MSEKSSPDEEEKSRAIDMDLFLRRRRELPFLLIAGICVVLAVAHMASIVKGDTGMIAVLVGTAIVALLAPRIESFALGKDGIKAELVKQIEETAKTVKDTKQATSEIDEQISQKIGQLFEEIKLLRAERVDENGPAIKPRHQGTVGPILPEPKFANDPQKGRFGGREIAGGRRLAAVVTKSSVKSEWCNVMLSVAAEPDAEPLVGRVEFFLHDSFEPDYYSRPVGKQGVASLSVRAWGAFTVGAIADDGRTLLELDLATSPNVSAPKDWRMR